MFTLSKTQSFNYLDTILSDLIRSAAFVYRREWILMSMNTDIANVIHKLAATGLEGLEYVHKNNMEGQFENTVTVLSDIVEAFNEIEQALNNNGFLEDSSDLDLATQSLRDGFDWIVSAYERQEDGRKDDIMELTLLPRYKAWQGEIGRCLGKYLLV